MTCLRYDAGLFTGMFNARCETVAKKSAFSRLLSRRRCIVPVQGFYEWKTAQQSTKADDAKQPFYVHAHGDSLLLMAGLYDVWDPPSTPPGECTAAGAVALPGAAAATSSPPPSSTASPPPLYSYTVLTTDSGDTLGWLHSRQPVLLTTAAAAEAWLDSDTYPDLQSLSQPPDGSVSGMFRASVGAPAGAASTPPHGGPGGLRWHPVTPAIGKSSYDGADCAAVWDETAKARRAGGGAAITEFFKRSPKGVKGGSSPPRGTKRRTESRSPSLPSKAPRRLAGWPVSGPQVPCRGAGGSSMAGADAAARAAADADGEVVLVVSDSDD